MSDDPPRLTIVSRDAKEGELHGPLAETLRKRQTERNATQKRRTERITFRPSSPIYRSFICILQTCSTCPKLLAPTHEPQTLAKFGAEVGLRQLAGTPFGLTSQDEGVVGTLNSPRGRAEGTQPGKRYSNYVRYDHNLQLEASWCVLSKTGPKDRSHTVRCLSPNNLATTMKINRL